MTSSSQIGILSIDDFQSDLSPFRVIKVDGFRLDVLHFWEVYALWADTLAWFAQHSWHSQRNGRQLCHSKVYNDHCTLYPIFLYLSFCSNETLFRVSTSTVCHTAITPLLQHEWGLDRMKKSFSFFKKFNYNTVRWSPASFRWVLGVMTDGTWWPRK